MISNIPAQLDLKQLRIDAKLKQTDLAKRLNVTQSQILRYEAEPDNVPLRVVREWVEACGRLNIRSGLDFKAPYEWIASSLANVENYSRNQPRLEPNDTIVQTPSGVEKLIKSIKQLGGKPRVVLCGHYDAGKSRLANTLLGSDRLHTAYQPVTRIICLLRHISDKPAWQTEDVWIMDDAFDLSDSLNESVCMEHRLIAGDLETLRRFGSHSGDELPNGEAGSALVYLNSQILNACELIDTPGLGNDKDDDELAESANAYADAILYLSPINGFMSGVDISAIPTLLKSLSAPSTSDRLARLFVLATHAHAGISDEEITAALDRGAERLFAAISPMFADENSNEGTPLDAPSLRSRFFPWYVETAERRVAFEADFQNLLQNIFPQSVALRLNEATAQFKQQAIRELSKEMERINNLLTDRENAAQRMALLIEAEPDRQRVRDENEQRIKTLISQYKSETKDFIGKSVVPLFTEEALKILIEERYKNSKDAEREAGAAVITDATKLIEHFINDRSVALAAEVAIFLEKYDDRDLGSVGIPFDAKAAFLGGVAGTGIFGALTAWAALVAGGSNLGAYLLVPQVVSLLSSLGIGIAGGTATGVSIVAALGGPVSVGIGIALAIGTITWQALGRSWQTRLARGLATKFAKMNIYGTIWVRCEKCWDDTLKAFEQGARSTEMQHRNYLANLQAQLEVPAEVLRERQARIQARHAFLTYIPWSANEGAAQ